MENIESCATVGAVITPEEFMDEIKWWWDRPAFEARCIEALETSGSLSNIRLYKKVPEHALNIFIAYVSISAEATQDRSILGRIEDALSDKGLKTDSDMISFREVGKRLEIKVGVETPPDLTVIERVEDEINEPCPQQ
jgi:hypothetical protein